MAAGVSAGLSVGEPGKGVAGMPPAGVTLASEGRAEAGSTTSSPDTRVIEGVTGSLESVGEPGFAVITPVALSSPSLSEAPSRGSFKSFSPPPTSSSISSWPIQKHKTRSGKRDTALMIAVTRKVFWKLLKWSMRKPPRAAEPLQENTQIPSTEFQRARSPLGTLSINVARTRG